MPTAIGAGAVSVTFLTGIGFNAAGFGVLAAVLAGIGLVSANYALCYQLSAVEGRLRLRKYFGAAGATVALGALEKIIVRSRPQGRMPGTIQFVSPERKFEIAPRFYERGPLVALLQSLESTGVAVDPEVWEVVSPPPRTK